MSTEFYNRNWRMPKSSNSSKVSNYSMSFDGSSQKITFDTINLGTSNSVSAWAKRNNPTTSSEFLIGGSFGFGYGVYFYQNSIIYIRNTSGTTLTFSNSAITTALSRTDWVHWTFIRNYSASTVDIYVDGTLAESVSSSAGLDSISSIGGSGQLIGAQYIWNGQIDHVAIFDYALSASQVTSLYGNSTDGVGNPMALSTKPVAYYKIGDKALFNGSEYLVTNAASEVYSPYALDFDGTNDYIDCGNDSSLNISGDLCISAWVKIDAHKFFNGIVSKIDATNRNYEILVRIGGNISFYTNDGAGGSPVQTNSTTTIPINTWTHLAIVVDSGASNGTKFYFNGVQDATTGTHTVVSNSANLNIGRRTTGSFYMNGKMSNISIWNTALTSTQVTELYNQGKPGNLNNHSAYSNLVSWWQLGENSSFDGTNWTVLDEKETNNGTSANMTEADLVNGVGTSANGLSDGMGGADNIIGDAPYSTANAVSYGMGVDALSTSVPS